MAEEDWKQSSLKILQSLRKDSKEAGKPVICLRCNKELPEGSNVCPFCGHPLSDKGRKILLEFCTKPEKDKTL